MEHWRRARPGGSSRRRDGLSSPGVEAGRRRHADRHGSLRRAAAGGRRAGGRCADRALRDREAARGGWHGCGVCGPGYRAGARRGAEDRAAARRGRCDAGAAAPRGQGDGAAVAPQRGAGVRHRRPRRPAVHRDGAGRRRDAALVGRHSRGRGAASCSCSSRPGGGSRRRTPRASSTATSSPTTSWSGGATSRGSPTSGSRASSTTAPARGARWPSGSDSELSLITATGSLAGTPAYMAPEQLLGRPERRRRPISSASACRCSRCCTACGRSGPRRRGPRR